MDDYDEKKDYCGPGSWTVSTDPETNRACYEHDKAYGVFGKIAYFMHNPADDTFLNKLNAVENPSLNSRLAKYLFLAKKLVAPHYVPKEKNHGKDKMKRDYWKIAKKRKSESRKRVRFDVEDVRPLVIRKRWRKIKNYGPYIKKRVNGKMARRKYVKRNNNKRRRFNYRKRGNVSNIKKLVRNEAKKIVANQINAQIPTESVIERGFYGVGSGLVATQQTPAINREVAFGRTYFGNRVCLNAAYSAAGGSFSNELREIYLEKYSEKHTIQNTCLFPVVVTVYKHFFKNGWVPVVGNDDLNSDYTTAASETGLYGVTEINDNTVSVTGTPSWNDGSAAGMELWKANLTYNQPLPTWVTDAQRSFCIAEDESDVYGQQAGITGCIVNRPFGMINMKLKQLNQVKFYKQKTITLAPGQQFSVSFKKKHVRLNYEDIGSAANTETLSGVATYMPGSTGYTFVAHGLMTHDTTLTAGAHNLAGIGRSSFTLAVESIVFFHFKQGMLATTSPGRATSKYYVGTTIATEGRAGLEVEETALN